MKIYIQNLRPGMSLYNGKGKFIQRLAKELRSRKGVKIVDRPEKCDINFRMNTLPSTEYGKRVVRLDGFNFTLKSESIIDENKNSFKEVLQNADGVIFQSKYAQQLLFNYIESEGCIYGRGEQRIIPNGVDPYDFKPKAFVDIYRKYFLFACQTLHPIRRLESLLNIWQTYDTKRWLYIIFDHDKNYTDIDFSLYKQVKVFNVMEQEQLNKFMLNSIAVINLTYRDSCPNLLIEALACGAPVIADKESGIWEYIEGAHGQQVDISLPIRDNAYPIKNPYEIVKAMDYLNLTRHGIELPNCLKIRNVADKYIKFFEKVLNE